MTNMMRMVQPLAALAMVALVGAGCSSGSSAGTDTGSSGGGDKNATSRDKTVRFAECMRDNGVAEFPDPNAAGDQEFVNAIQKLDLSSAAWKKAIGACKDLQPPGLLGGKATPRR